MTPGQFFAITLAVTCALPLVLLAGYRLWWVFVDHPRFQRRCDHYITHINYVAAAGETRCHCADCVAFRREMGWGS